MLLRPICEPVELPQGRSVLAELVVIDPSARDVGRFMHFHDVAELVLFRRVRGSFIADGRRHPLGDGAIVFIPSMRHHDFELEDRREYEGMEWVLVQMDPYLIEALARGFPRLSRPFCVRPCETQRARFELLADWLIETAGAQDPKVERIVELLLLSAAEINEHSFARPDPETPNVERLLPALELLRRAPGSPLAHEQAATACRLSPAYFSRRFRQEFKMTFSDYARTYRLHLGARRLIGSDEAISKIAYGLGFSSPAHFTARFRERFGMTPREYRASARMRFAA